MHLLAAEAGTWGISGPAFAGLYLIAAIVLLITTLLIQRRIRRGRPVQRDLHPYEVAYLIGGPRRTARAGGRAETCAGGHQDRSAAARTEHHAGLLA